MTTVVIERGDLSGLNMMATRAIEKLMRGENLTDQESLLINTYLNISDEREDMLADYFLH